MRAFLPTLPTLIGLLFSSAVFGHGTSEPGPHGGEIRMPGAFHVEADVTDGQLRLYLLNMQFKNPMVDTASVNARIEQGDKTAELDCTPNKEAKAFVCTLPSGVGLEQGTLVVEASRDGMPADPARYELPLKWPDR